MVPLEHFMLAGRYVLLYLLNAHDTLFLLIEEIYTYPSLSANSPERAVDIAGNIRTLQKLSQLDYLIRSDTFCEVPQDQGNIATY
jgi:hypothetical protein